MFHQKVTLSAEVIPDDVEQLVKEFLESSNAQFVRMCVEVTSSAPQVHLWIHRSTPLSDPESQTPSDRRSEFCYDTVNK